MKRLPFLLTALVLFFQAMALAQVADFDSSATYNIQTRDGNAYQGKILERNKESIRIETKTIGTISIQQSNVKSYTRITDKDFHNGEFWYESPYGTRYFFGPNAYGLKKGEGYYQNTWVFMNQVSYGFSENFTMGVGTIPLFLFGVTEGTPFWLTPKVTIPVKEDQLNFMAGGIVGTAIGADGNYGGIAYTGMTLGSRDRNGTIGLGWGFANGQVATRPTVSLSFMTRVSKRFYFMTENYYINTGQDPVAVVSAGGRLAYERIALDFGLFRPVFFGDSSEGNDFIIGLPWLGVHVPFGNK